MVHWHVAVLASAVRLVFVGNPNVIVGGEPSNVELVGHVSGVGGVVAVVLFITTHSGGVPLMGSKLEFPLMF